jgi:hypothetical protein
VPSHARFFSLLLTLCVLALALVLFDASRLRRTRGTRATEVTRLLGLPDLALSSTARWLRHRSQAEPAAGTADGPYALDVEPGGGVLLPPSTLYRAESRSLRRVP